MPPSETVTAASRPRGHGAEPEPRTRDARLEGLVAEVCAGAALPLERARTLPPEAYVSPDLWALEVERIFRREWMCVARAEQVAEPGSTLSVDLVGEPIVLTRDEGGRLHALSRVCRHRAMDVMAGRGERCGRETRLTCPYHLWTYRLDGALIGAPEMKRAEGFDRAEHGLHEFAVEVWQGFVFVCLDRDAPPLAPRLAAVAELIAPIDLTRWALAATVPWGEVAANWKVVIENASECYHHMGTHAQTLQPLWPASTIVPEGDARWFWGAMRVSEALAAGHEDGVPLQPTFLPPVAGLSAARRSTTLIVGVFPMFFFALSPDMATWYAWLPTGPASHTLDIGVLVPPGADAAPGYADAIERIVASLREIQEEDAAACLGVQRGVASRHAPIGRLSHLERPLWLLQRYLAGRLAAETVAPGAALVTRA